MNSWKELLILVAGYAFIFFVIALWETRNLKDSFDEWINAMLDWRDHAIPGLIFLGILGVVIFILAHA